MLLKAISDDGKKHFGREQNHMWRAFFVRFSAVFGMCVLPAPASCNALSSL